MFSDDLAAFALNTTPSRYFIYGLIDPRDGALRYVGKTSRGMARPRAHSCPSLLLENTHKAHWLGGLVKAGLRPVVTILEVLEHEDGLSEAERYCIAYLRSIGCRLTNATDGGEGACGTHASAATRAKMSEIRRGRKNSPEHCVAISRALQGHRVSEETRRKIGDIHKGNTYCVGRKLSDASRKKMSESVRSTSPFLGKKLPEATVAKMREAAKRRRRSSNGTFVGAP